MSRDATTKLEKHFQQKDIDENIAHINTILGRSANAEDTNHSFSSLTFIIMACKTSTNLKKIQALEDYAGSDNIRKLYEIVLSSSVDNICKEIDRIIDPVYVSLIDDCSCLDDIDLKNQLNIVKDKKGISDRHILINHECDCKMLNDFMSELSIEYLTLIEEPDSKTMMEIFKEIICHEL